MLQKSFSEAPIVFRAEPITREQVRRFIAATGSEYHANNPLTFPTVWRAPEFQWLDRLKFDLRELLHTDQEYEYLAPVKEGDIPTIYTKIKEIRERRGITFVCLESEVRMGDVLTVITRSSFVVRSQGEANS